MVQGLQVCPFFSSAFFDSHVWAGHLRPHIWKENFGEK
jgi:hypothetical protein